MERVLVLNEPVENVFCATGKGGGIDPTCSKGGKGLPVDDDDDFELQSAGAIAQHDTIRSIIKSQAGSIIGVADLRKKFEEAHPGVDIAPILFDLVEKGFLQAGADDFSERVLAQGGIPDPKGGRPIGYVLIRNQREFIINDFTENVFCATGPGGGVDPTCPAGGRGTAISVDTLKSMLGTDPKFGTLTGIVTDSGPLTVKAYRVGATEDRFGRGTYFSGDKAGAEAYSTLHPEHTVKEYEITLQKPFIAAHQKDVTKHLFNKEYWQLHLMYGGGADAGRKADVKVAKELKKRGYDGLILLRPAPPASTEVAVFKGTKAQVAEATSE